MSGLPDLLLIASLTERELVSFDFRYNTVNKKMSARSRLLFDSGSLKSLLRRDDSKNKKVGWNNSILTNIKILSNNLIQDSTSKHEEIVRNILLEETGNVIKK